MNSLRRVAALILAAWVVHVLGTAGCQPSQPVELVTEPPPAPPPPRQVTLAAVGDVMLDRSVGASINQKGCAHIIEAVASELKRADITFGNLECPLSTVRPHSPQENLVFRADPKTVKVLALGGFDIVSLANNHTLNAGRAGLLQTLTHLEEAGIAYVGAAADKAEGSRPVFIEVDRLKVGFLAYTDLSFAHGSYSKIDEDLGRLQTQIAQAKNKCDLLVVSYHWGTEYHGRPSQRQVKVAHATIDAGADVILGHHPHVLQGVEIYRRCPILYSLGNFIFDQRAGERMESGLFTLHYEEDRGWRVAMKPIWIPWSRLGPEYATGERQAKILHRFTQLCEQLDTKVITEAGQALIAAPQTEQAAGPRPQGRARVAIAQGGEPCLDMFAA